MGERRRSLLSSFAEAGDVRPGAELHVSPAQRGQLGHPQPCVSGYGEKCPVTAPPPGVGVGRSEQGVDFVVVEERHHPRIRAFCWDGEHSGDEGTVLRVTVCSEPVEGVDRRESGVSCRDAVGALSLEVVEEPGDRGGVEVDEIELGGLPAGSVLGVAQQQAEGVAVGSDRARAGSALVDEISSEVLLDGCRQGRHDLRPVSWSTRRLAKSSSSGEADWYQYVAAGFACPRNVDRAGTLSSISPPSS